MIEPQDISRVQKSPLRNALSLVDDEVSQATSVSVSLNTEAHRMVANLLDSENAEIGQSSAGIAFENAEYVELADLGPTVEVTPPRKLDDDTSYGLNDLNASDFVRALHKYSPQKQTQGSPRPHLPSIYNSPFAPQADDATPVSRPGTAKRMSPGHSRHNSQQKSPQQQHRPSGIFMESTMSSMQHTSSFGITQTPIENNNMNNFKRNMAGDHYGVIGGPVLAHNPSRAFGAFEFNSSEISHGTPWALSGQSARNALNLRTPPNGQGAG